MAKNSRAAGLFEDALAEARRSGDTMLAKDTVTGLGYIHEVDAPSRSTLPRIGRPSAA